MRKIARLPILVLALALSDRLHGLVPAGRPRGHDRDGGRPDPGPHLRPRGLRVRTGRHRLRKAPRRRERQRRHPQRERPGHGHHGPPLPLGRHRLDERHPELAPGRGRGLLPRRTTRPTTPFWSSSATSTRPGPSSSSGNTTGRSRPPLPRRPSRRSSRRSWAPRPSSCARRPRRRPSSRSGTGRATRTPISCPCPSWPNPCSRAKAAGSTAGSSARKSWPSTSSAAFQETIDPQLFTIFVKPRPGADLDRIDRVVEEELDKIRAEGITAQEYDKAMNIIRNDFYRGLQTISGKANQLGSAELVFGDFAKLFTRHGRLRRGQDRPDQGDRREIFRRGAIRPSGSSSPRKVRNETLRPPDPRRDVRPDRRRGAAPRGRPAAAGAGKVRPQERADGLSPPERRPPARQRPRRLRRRRIGLRAGRLRRRGRARDGPDDEGHIHDGRRRHRRGPRLHGRESRPLRRGGVRPAHRGLARRALPASPRDRRRLSRRPGLRRGRIRQGAGPEDRRSQVGQGQPGGGGPVLFPEGLFRRPPHGPSRLRNGSIAREDDRSDGQGFLQEELPSRPGHRRRRGRHRQGRARPAPRADVRPDGPSGRPGRRDGPSRRCPGPRAAGCSSSTSRMRPRPISRSAVQATPWATGSPPRPRP